MARILLFNKPFQVLSQFTDVAEERPNLSHYIKEKNVYAAGRLDYDSEGLLILTADGKLQHHLAHPKFKLEKIYWAQVEGIPSNEAIQQLQQGVFLKDGLTRKAKVRSIDEPNIWPRTPPIRERKNQPTHWLEIKITEGKNRQIRRMTAHVGNPCLRLIRYAIGPWSLASIKSGKYISAEINLPNPALKITSNKGGYSVQ